MKVDEFMEEREPCKFSVIIPVLHEASRINSLIDHLYKQKSEEPYEIIVVEGDPRRETLRAIKSNHVTAIMGEQGRARQMNAGAAVAHGEILIFLHADTQLPPGALGQVRAAMEGKRYVGGAFDLGIKSDRPIFRLISDLASWRSRFTRIPYGDQAIFIRKDYFRNIGGYREIPLMEDVELMRRIKKRGDPICILSHRVSTSPRRWEKEGIVCCTLRNWILSSLYFWGVPPDKLALFYHHGHRAYDR